jgi:DNA-binding transcriptional MerR regulator
LIKPQRTPKGHRLYCEADFAKVEKIVQLLGEGHSLTGIAMRFKQEEDRGQEQVSNLADSRTVWRDYRDKTTDAIHEFSYERLESVFNEATSLYPLDLVTRNLIEPTLKALGENWVNNPAGIAEEHFFSSWLRNRLSARFHHLAGQVSGAKIVFACTPGTLHDVGLLLFALSALGRGYRVVYLGADLPMEQLPAVVERSAARGIVIASRLVPGSAESSALAGLVTTVKVPVMLGGPYNESDMKGFESAGGVCLGSSFEGGMNILLRTVLVHGPGGLNSRVR